MKTIQQRTRRQIQNSILLLTLVTALSSQAIAKGKPDTEQLATGSVETAAQGTEQASTHTPDALNISASEQMARALSKRPKVVGKAKLDKEAAGLRKLSKQAIKHWRDGRLNPDFSAN